MMDSLFYLIYFAYAYIHNMAFVVKNMIIHLVINLANMQIFHISETLDNNTLIHV